MYSAPTYEPSMNTFLAQDLMANANKAVCIALLSNVNQLAIDQDSQRNPENYDQLDTSDLCDQCSMPFAASLVHFHPSPSCQVFGPDDRILGYRNLRVRMYYTSASLHVMLQVYHNGTSRELSHEDLDNPNEFRTDCSNPYMYVEPTPSPDNIPQLITERVFPYKVLHSQEQFQELLINNKAFVPPGTLIAEFETCPVHNASQVSQRAFEVFKASPRCTPSLDAYIDRVQSLQLWLTDVTDGYINSANDQWDYFFVYEVYQSLTSGSPQYAFVGFSAVHHSRSDQWIFQPTVTQSFVLPPYKCVPGLDVEAHLHHSINAHYRQLQLNPGVQGWEGPCENPQSSGDVPKSVDSPQMAPNDLFWRKYGQLDGDEN